MIKKRTRGNPMPLIVEKHPINYKGYPFITLIQYKEQDKLVIVDNYDDKIIDTYVLDLCGPERVDEEHIIEVVYPWWLERRNLFPVSIEFSRLGMTASVSKIFQSFHIEYVTRVIGPLPNFPMNDTTKVRRRKRKAVPHGVKIHNSEVNL
jgi:hypothetical protein